MQKQRKMIAGQIRTLFLGISRLHARTRTRIYKKIAHAHAWPLILKKTVRIRPPVRNQRIFAENLPPPSPPWLAINNEQTINEVKTMNTIRRTDMTALPILPTVKTGCWYVEGHTYSLYKPLLPNIAAEAAFRWNVDEKIGCSRGHKKLGMDWDNSLWVTMVDRKSVV